MTVLYHRTRHADEIIANGFRGRSSNYLSNEQHDDVVWLSEGPDDGDQELPDGTVIAVTVPPDVDVDQYEYPEDGKPRREWAVPSAVVNQWPRRLLPE